MSTGHSPWGASQYSRWGACPGSIKLSEGVPSTTSFYAAEGTVAHDIAADLLLGRMRPVVGSTRQCEGHTIPITDDMMEAVDFYVDSLQELIRDEAGNMLCETFVEQAFHLESIHDNLWGTADFGAYYPESKFLRVIDYKHGAGVPVEVTNNKQAKYYALGMIVELSKQKKPVTQVEIGIVQPRCPHPDGAFRSESFEAIELLDFGAQLLEDVEATLVEGAPLNPGDHCKWCPAAAICPALQDKAQELAKYEFGAVETALPDEQKNAQLPFLLQWLPVMEDWIKNVREYAYQQLRAGKEVDGWKLVAKCGTRQWVDEKEVVDFIKKNHKKILKEIHTIPEPKLKSPAQIEKLCPEGVVKKDFKNALQDFQKTVSSGTVLAPGTDKRPAVIEGPKADFKPVTTDEDIFS